MTEITIRSDMGVELIQTWGDDALVAKAARVSTGRDQIENSKISGLINYLVSEGHHSTLEHCGLTFRFEAPLFVLGQFVRHRHISPNVQSGRYTKFEPVFYLPSPERPLVNVGTSARPELVPSGDDEVDMNSRIRQSQSAEDAYFYYQQLLDLGVANEVARNVLPQSTYTSWYASANLRAWLHFLGLRNGSFGHPQYEIADLAEQVEEHFEEHFPLVYKAWRDGTP